MIAWSRLGFRQGVLFVVFAFVMVCLPLLSIPSKNTGLVSKVREHHILVDVGLSTVQVNGNFEVRVGDRVEWDKAHQKNTATHFGASNHVVKDAQVVVRQQIKGLRSRIYDFIRDHPSRSLLWLGEANSDIYDVLSLQMVLTAFYELVQKFMNQIGKKSWSKGIMMLFLCFHGHIIGYQFGHVYLLSRLLLSRDKQLLVLLALYPNFAFTVLFAFVYGLHCIKNFHPFCETISKTIVRICMSSYQFGLYNPILQSTFKLRRMLIGFCFILCLFFPNIVSSILQVIQWFVDHEAIKRFHFVGVMGIGVIVLLVYAYRKWHHKGVILLLCGFWLFQCYYPFQRITFMDVGQGDATLIQKEWGTYNVLVDTGRKFEWKRLKKSLFEKGVRELDVLVLTHADLDHIENTEELIQHFRPKELIDTKEKRVRGLESYLTDKVYDSTNANSLIFRAWEDVLLMGDSGVEQEADLILSNRNICASILKLGHHGSKTSTSLDFIHAVKPTTAIVSAGVTQYGHPHKQVLRSLYDNRVKVYNTAYDGNIVVEKLGRLYFLHTSKGKFDIMKPVIEC